MTDPRRRFFPMQLAQQVPGQSVQLSTRLQPVGSMPVAPVSAAPPGECHVRGVSLISPDAISNTYSVVDWSWSNDDPWQWQREIQLLHVTDDIYITTDDGRLDGNVLSIWQGQPQPQHVAIDETIVGRPDAALRMIYAVTEVNAITGAAIDACGFDWRFRWRHPRPSNYLTSAPGRAKVMPLGSAFAVILGIDWWSEEMEPGDVWVTPVEDLSDPYAHVEIPIVMPAAARELLDGVMDREDRLIATAYCADAPQASLVVDIVSLGE